MLKGSRIEAPIEDGGTESTTKTPLSPERLSGARALGARRVRKLLRSPGLAHSGLRAAGWLHLAKRSRSASADLLGLC